MKRFMHRHRGCGPEHRPEEDEGEGPHMARGHRWRQFFEAGHSGFGRPFGGGGPGRFHRHGERRRMFEGGELKLVFLALMEAEPRHGYDLIRAIETRTGGAYAPSPGIVYPTLTLLEEIGHIEAQASEGAKRQFALTEAGKAFLAEHRREAEAALGRLDAVGDRAMPMEAGPIARAMQNLKTALGQRLSNQPDKKVLFEVADLIDEAARKIERL
ncbi:PadR family transcriptional regulator [Rhodoblastus sp.]|uniref:PadR family transcriptional regulator n=1 Tax=Rhodoblastus sp. TaxID=1962975 RepID=UPI003F9A6E87